MILEEIEEITVDLEEIRSYDDTEIKKRIKSLEEKIENINIPDTSNFITQEALNGYAKENQIPTNISDLTNDSGYLTGFEEEDPIFSNSPAKNITQQDITDWNNKSSFSGNYEDLSNKPTIPKIPHIPTKFSELTDDIGYSTIENMNTAISNAINSSITSVLESEF